jgi:hypothetical protein
MAKKYMVGLTKDERTYIEEVNSQGQSGSP